MRGGVRSSHEVPGAVMRCQEVPGVPGQVRGPAPAVDPAAPAPMLAAAHGWPGPGSGPYRRPSHGRPNPLRPWEKLGQPNTLLNSNF